MTRLFHAAIARKNAGKLEKRLKILRKTV